MMHHKSADSAVYGLGLIGALVYFIQVADSITSGIVGIVKAFIWPAIVVFELLKFLYS